MLLMNKDIPVLEFNTEEYTVNILNNEMLPFYLRDNLINSKDINTISDGIKNFDKIRHFFADRVLSVSRDNAKQILESIQNKQHLTEEESFQLSLKCRGVSVNDCFWIKNDNENLSYIDVNIRNKSLSDITYQISLIGTPLSIEHNLLDADISTKGMFRKTWAHEPDGLYLYKSDRTANYINTKAEIEVSNLLKNSNINHVEYEEAWKDDVFCCKCKCVTNDKYSFVEAEYIKSYIERKGLNFLEYIKDNFTKAFANMVVCDYLFANPDRHIDNWGFKIDNDTNEIIGLFPLFDHNQALIALYLNKEKEFDELIYDPTNKTTYNSVLEWFPFSDLNFQNLPKNFENRLALIKNASITYQNEKINF